MKRTFTILLLVLTTAALFLTGCQASPAAPAAEEEASADTEPMLLRMALTPYLSNAAIYVALEEGYFLDAGLEVEIVSLASSRESLPALIQGQVDIFAPSLSTTLLNAFAQDAPLAIVADKGNFAEGDCYTSLLLSPVQAENGGLEALESLEGLTYGADSGNISQIGVERWVRENYGLELDEMSFERTPNEIIGEALASGAVTLTVSVEPQRTQLIESGQAILLADAYEFLPDAQWTTIVFGPTILKDNPELGRRFMVGYLRGVRQYNEGKTDRNIEILAETTGFTPEEVANLCWPTISDTLQINQAPIQEFIEWGVEHEEVDAQFDISDFVDMSFVDYALAEVDGNN